MFDFMTFRSSQFPAVAAKQKQVDRCVSGLIFLIHADKLEKATQ